MTTPEATPPSLDDDSPGTVRKTFAILFFVAGCICLMPRQWVSAGILFVVSAIVAYPLLRAQKPTKSEPKKLEKTETVRTLATDKAD